MKAAEQARLACLGANQAECVTWDELKPEMRERWARVVDAAQKPIYAELEAVTAERDAAQAECKHLNAVIADMGPVDPDAWKTDLKLRDRTAGGLKTGCATKDHVLVITEPYGVCLSPSDAAITAAWLASYASAHGCPVSGAIQYKRNPANDGFVDMPTDAQVEALARVLQRAYMKECYVDANECTPNAGYLAEARAAYAHIGRVPVAWELDVTADEALRVYANGGKSIGGMHNTLDLCRSRIRPTYECKECAKRSPSKQVYDMLVGKLDRVRAALEGE